MSEWLWSPDSPMWCLTELRLALARHEVQVVYRVLQRHGVSQRLIAVATEQTQPEISEILCGRRVTSYALLARIAAGLRVPRERMGLGFDDETLSLLASATLPTDVEGYPLRGRRRS